MKLATFIAPGDSDPQAGEVRGDEIVAFDDRHACSIASPPATARPPTARVLRARPTSACSSRCRARRRSSASAATTPPTSPSSAPRSPRSRSSSSSCRSRASRPSGPVKRPKATQALDYEVELVLVMGPDNTIAGYAVADDVSARDLQRSEAQWSRAKGFDTSCPWGPWITTARRDPDAGEPAAHHPRQRRAAPGRQHQRPDLRPAGARRLHRRGLHARARRDHPHRHAERRRRGVQAAPLPAAGRHRARARSRASGRSSTRSRLV